MRQARIYSAPQFGFTLVEVLVTLVILSVGLMGLAGLQTRMLNTQFEAYQRAQALMLAEDMASRLRTNIVTARAATYAVATQYGTGNSLGDTTCTSNDDLCVWSQALKGTSVKQGSQSVGSMIGARGCLQTLPGGSATSQQVIRVTVAWQGLSPTIAPASACGKDTYGGDDRLRRTVSVDVTLAYLGV